MTSAKGVGTGLPPELLEEQGGWPPLFEHLERFADSEPDAAVVGVLSVEPFLTRAVRLQTPPPGWDILPAGRLEGWAEGHLGHRSGVRQLIPAALENPAWPRFLFLDGFPSPSSHLDHQRDDLIEVLSRFLRLPRRVRRGRVLFVATTGRLSLLDSAPTFAYQTVAPLEDPTLGLLGVSATSAQRTRLAQIFADRDNLLLQAAFRIRRRGGDLSSAIDDLVDLPGITHAQALLLRGLATPDPHEAARPPADAADSESVPRATPPFENRPARESASSAGGSASPLGEPAPSASQQPLDEERPAAPPPSAEPAAEERTTDRTGTVGRFLPLGSTITAADHLNRQGLVEALAAMLEDPQQETPLTIALLGDWGSGKSTLMALLRKRLLDGSPRRFCFADFNAWEYELTDNMAAGLAQEVVAGITDDTRLALRRPWTARGNSPEAPAGGRGVLRLSRWLSPGFWWLFGGFVLRRHGVRLAAIALVIATLLWALRSGLLTPAQIAPGDEDIQQGLGVAGALGAVVALFYLLRAAKHILEHPFAIGLQTYLRLPRYEQHLGLVPSIKREVETLTRLWLGRPWSRRRMASWLAKGDRARRYPRLERWSRPRRLVVFVDDLDRCSHARIGQTLDAIRLVIDLPQVVVVLGIDPRIAFQAMALQYEDYAEPQRSKEEIARDYLGKIIQVPIRLRRPSPRELEEFVGQRLFRGAASSAAAPIGVEMPPASSREARDDVADLLFPNPDMTFGGGAAYAQAQVDSAIGFARSRGMRSAGSDKSNRSGPRVDDPLQRQLAEVMQPDAEERRLFQELVAAFGFHNPRQLIRLFNSYNLLKLFAASRETAGERQAPRLELMRTLFVEELLHETPAKVRAEVERGLTGGRMPASLPADLRSRLAAVRALRKRSTRTGNPDGGPEGRHGEASAVAAWAGLDEVGWRELVRLVVLPAAAEEAASNERRAAAAAAGTAARTSTSRTKRRASTGRDRDGDIRVDEPEAGVLGMEAGVLAAGRGSSPVKRSGPRPDRRTR